MVNGEFSNASVQFLRSLVGKPVVIEMMNGEAGHGSLPVVSALLHGDLVDVYEDAILLDRGGPTPERMLVFAMAIRAIYERKPKSSPQAKMGAR